MVKIRVFWTPLAIRSLEETKKFILEHWSNQVLEFFLDLVDKRIEQVLINPEIAPVISETNYRKLVIHKNISLFYIHKRFKFNQNTALSGIIAKILRSWKEN